MHLYNPAMGERGRHFPLWLPQGEPWAWCHDTTFRWIKHQTRSQSCSTASSATVLSHNVKAIASPYAPVKHVPQQSVCPLLKASLRWACTAALIATQSASAQRSGVYGHWKAWQPQTVLQREVILNSDFKDLRAASAYEHSRTEKLTDIVIMSLCFHT